MKRNLLFWTRYTWEIGGVILGLAAIFSAVTFLGTEGMDFSLFASTTPYLLCVSAVFIMLLVNIGSQTLYVPLLLSMGELRRNVLLGFFYYRVLIVAVTTLLCALVWLLVPGEVSSIGLRSIPTILCALTLAASAGSILGTLFVKWKWVGLIIVVILSGGAGGMVGATSAAFFKGLSITGNPTELVSHLLTPPWWLIAAMPAALAADIAFQWLLLRRREVKL